MMSVVLTGQFAKYYFVFYANRLAEGADVRPVDWHFLIFPNISQYCPMAGMASFGALDYIGWLIPEVPEVPTYSTTAGRPLAYIIHRAST
jgi:hypothetical protein